MHAAQSSHWNLIKHSQAHLRTVTLVHVYTVAPLLVYTFFTSDLPVHLHLHLHVSYSTSCLTYDHRAFRISHVACLSHFFLHVYSLLGHHTDSDADADTDAVTVEDAVAVTVTDTC